LYARERVRDERSNKATDTEVQASPSTSPTSDSKDAAICAENVSGTTASPQQPTSKNVFLDAGVRHGISHAAPDWEFTVGLTFGFSLSTFSRQ